MPDDRFEYYAYVQLCVDDDCLCICNGFRAWSSSPSKYVQEVARELGAYL